MTTVNRDGRTQEVTAGAVLNAAGAWAGEIAALAHLHLPIYAVPLSMNVIERTQPLIPHLVQHASKRLTLKQVAAGQCVGRRRLAQSVCARWSGDEHAKARRTRAARM